MSTPLVLLTGIDAEALASAMIALQWDVPDAVAVRHEIDVERQILTRTVSDVSGIVERIHLDLDHACVSCALREDIMPTLVRLADDGQWSTIIAHLPVSADATQVCRVLDHDETLARSLHVASVIAVVNGPTVRADLLGDDLLRERRLQTSASDNRGVAEVHAALIEYADAAVIVGDVEPTDRHLVSMLQRPDAIGAVDHLDLDTARLVSVRRPHQAAENWVHPAHIAPVGLVETGQAWTIELRSDRPFHPQRLLDNIGALGGGARRSRGCFWLPTRPTASRSGTAPAASSVSGRASTTTSARTPASSSPASTTDAMSSRPCFTTACSPTPSSPSAAPSGSASPTASSRGSAPSVRPPSNRPPRRSRHGRAEAQDVSQQHPSPSIELEGRADRSRSRAGRRGDPPGPPPARPGGPPRPHHPSGHTMKVRNSLRSLKQQPGAQVVRRRGRTFVINKQNPRFKGRQG